MLPWIIGRKLDPEISPREWELRRHEFLPWSSEPWSSHARCGQDELPVLLGWCVEEAPWPAHQSSCPGALASRARCWLPGAPSCGRFIHIIVSNLLMQAACKYKERSNLGSHANPPEHPACCCLPRRDAAALLLNLGKSSTCVCDRRFLFQNTDTVGCLFSWDNQLLFFPSRMPTQP